MGKAKEKLDKLREEKKKLKEIKERVKKKKKLRKKLEKKENKKLAPKEVIEKVKKKEDKKHKISSYAQKKRFSNFIGKAGFETDFAEVNKKIMYGVGAIIVATTLYLLITFFINKTFFSEAIKFLLFAWVLGSLALYFAAWISFFIYIDLKILQRKKEIERVFPDFLQLTAANINAGMPIDRALWFAIRPRFGILAKEMETVAKATMVGESLPRALLDFTEKYDSMTVKRSISLLLEGLESGGEVGELLVKVANNIRDTEMIKKEMASSVTTYVIFILFATLGAAPFLFGLTTELILVMQTIIGDINLGDSAQSFGGVGSMMTMSPDAISLTDYKIFAVINICMSSVFAAILISVIQKGNATEAVKKAPIYIILGLLIYFISFTVLSHVLGGFLV